MHVRLRPVLLVVVLEGSILACQSGPETSPDGERSPGDQTAVPITTATSLSIEEGTSFQAGDTITLRARVTPAPDGGILLFFATVPVRGGAPAEDVVGGTARRKVVCGSPRVPFGSHTAQAHYQGTDAFLGGSSATIAYTCLDPAD